MARYLDESFLDGIFDVPQYKVSTEDCYGWLSQPWLTYDNYIKLNCIVKLEKETKNMEAKKCDRCGKLYEQNGDRARVRFKFKEVYGADDLKEEAIAKRQLEEVYIKSCSTELDLCPECKESFKKWFEES